MVSLKPKKIILTGGGSAGHVTPNIALMPKLKELGYEIQYIGTKDGIEKKIIEKENIEYHIISSGKLRRYFDLKNFTDPFRVVKGVWDAAKIIKKEKPNVVFSKGGFVSVPVVLAAFFHKVPVIIHESDYTPGLANKIAIPYCTKVCVTFPESLKHIKKGKGVMTGSPIRKELLEGSRITGAKLCGFQDKKPILMVVGGSLGSKFLNEIIRSNLDRFLKSYNIIHICGKGNLATHVSHKIGYKQFEYVSEELPHLMAASDLFITRAGANTLFELLALKKPHLLIPLPATQSRGDQILNAKSFEKSGYSMVLEEENLNAELLLKTLHEIYENRASFVAKMSASAIGNGVDGIIKLIEEHTKG